MKTVITLILGISFFFMVGCSKTTVVLLDSGKSKNAVLVSTNKGTQKLDTVGSYVGLSDANSAPSKPKVMSTKEISSRFSEVLEAAPKKAISHIVYFKVNSTELTQESIETLHNAISDIEKSFPCTVDIIGHTDTVGSNEVNSKVSLKRAKYIELLIQNENLKIVSIKSKGYGEEDLLVPTADNIDEARNRNVEIFIK